MTDVAADVAGPMTTPGAYGDKPLPRRSRPKGLLPSTWQGRSLRVEYIDADDRGVSTTGTLLDTFPVGPCLNLAGARVIVSWDRLVALELTSS